MHYSLEKRSWWGYIHSDLKQLLKESELLIETVSLWDQKFHDYAFIVFPAAKAYEGFLKRLFLDLGFISEKRFYGKRFRIGKALNPSLDRKLQKKVGVYHKLVNYCGGEDLARELWDAWKYCRNLLFHWFPNEKNAVTYKEAKERVEKILSAMDAAFQGCDVSSTRKT
jgi:hypothetical protein